MNTSGCFLPRWASALMTLALLFISVLIAKAQTAPSIYSGPTSRSVALGSDVTIRVFASGSAPLFFQWRFNGTNLNDDTHISGATTSSLVISNAQTPDAGPYSVIVSNSVGWVTSTNAQLTFNAIFAPSIYSGPTNRSVDLGSDVTIRVFTSGSTPLFYQWRFNGTNLNDDLHISGSTTSALVISNAQAPDAGAYSVFVSNSVGWVISTNAQLTFNPTFTLEEALDTTNLVWQTDSSNPWTGENPDTHDGVDAAQSGSTLGLSSYVQTTIEGPAAVNFWWRASFHPLDHAGILVDSNEVASISGSTPWQIQSVYISSGSHSLQWLFSKDQSNLAYNSRAYVDQVTVTAPTLPVINSAPTSQSVEPGTSLIFTLLVSGMLPITYQWQFNGTNLANATDTALWLTNLQTNASGSYTLIASNGAGTVASDPIILSIATIPPTITQSPVSKTNYYGVSTSFSVTATGTPPLSYQWQFNGTNLANATGTTLTIANPQPVNAGSYQVVVSNAAAATTSAAATLTVLDPTPTISPLPTSKSVLLGSFTNITASSATGYDLHYQWRLNGTNLVNSSFVSGATNGTLILPRVRANQAGSYSVVVFNAYGSVSSSKCDLSVQSAVAWGAGANPPYGDEPNFGQATVPAGLMGVTALSGGRYHSLALQSNGTVVAWGAGTNDAEIHPFYGQSIVPSGLNTVKAIAAGGFHSLALKSDGTVIAWGAGTNWPVDSTVHFGQSAVPANLGNVKAIAAGAYHSLALRADGTVISWGLQTNVPANLTNVMAIAAGFGHSLALLSNGTVIAWGTNNFSQTNVPATLSNVVAVAAGDYHSLALKADGTVISWGKQVGNPFTAGFVDIAAAGDHNIGIRTNADIYTWGSSGNGLSTIPVTTNVICIGAGYLHNLAAVGDGLPVIKYSPRSQTVFAGDNVTFNSLAAVVGLSWEKSYQWRRNGTNLPGATGTALTLNKVQYTNAGTYVVVVTNLYGAITSAPALLSISIPIATTNLGVAVDATNFVWTTSGNAPWFGQSNIIHGGSTAAQSGAIGDSQQSSLQTTLIGPGTISFWWQVSSEEYFDYLNFYIGGSLRSSISGSTGWKQESFSIPAGPQTLEWRYVKDSSSSVGPDAAWLDQIIFLGVPPTITLQPVSQFVLLGGTAQFTVQASGTPPLTYRWTKGGVTVPGATNSTLTLTNVVRNGITNYAVVISNSGGATTSSNAMLIVRVPQKLGSTQPLMDGSFQLISRYSDNWPLQPGEVARFDAFASTNLIDWLELTNALSVTNGQLLLHDRGATNWPTRYYRIVEH